MAVATSPSEPVLLAHAYAVWRVVELWELFFDQVVGALLRSTESVMDCGIDGVGLDDAQFLIYAVFDGYCPDMFMASPALHS